MRIPTGNFGYTVAQPAPLVDPRPAYDAIATLGNAAARAGLQVRDRRRLEDEALRRQRASNAMNDESANAEELLAEASRRIERGELEDERAREWLDAELAKKATPAPEGLDPVTLEDFNHGIGITRRKAAGRLDAFLEKRRGDRLLTETTRGLEVLKRNAGVPGADVAAINERVRALKPSLLAAGVDAATADAKLAEVATANWTNEVERRLTDARNDTAALAQLGSELSAKDGFYLDKLDVERRNGLHRSVVLRADALAAEAARLAKERAKDAEEDASREALENVLLEGGRLDYAQKDHRDFVADLFASRARDLGLDTPIIGTPVLTEAQRIERTGKLAQLGIGIASRTGIVPEQLESLIRVGVHSPTPIVAALAADTYARLKVTAPELTGQVDADTRGFSEIARSMIDVGTPPARAIETARASTFDAKPELIEQRRAKWAGKDGIRESQPKALAKFIDRDFDPGLFAFEPAASERLRADFDMQSERYYLKTGDADLARDLAWEDMTRIYGQTRVNGEAVLSLFPVERFGITPEEVRKDIEAAIAQFPQADGSKAEEIALVPDNLTLRAVNDALSGRPISPTYRLVTKSGDLVLDDHGLPLRYALPGGEELTKRLHEQRDAAIKRDADNLEEARARRERRRRLEAERIELEASGYDARRLPVGLGGP